MYQPEKKCSPGCNNICSPQNTMSDEVAPTPSKDNSKLRDHFAGIALARIMNAATRYGEYETVIYGRDSHNMADTAYEYADAMLDAKKGSETNE